MKREEKQGKRRAEKSLNSMDNKQVNFDSDAYLSPHLTAKSVENTLLPMGE